MQAQDQCDAKSEFAWSVHSYVNEYIRFADTKAAVVVGWCLAVFSGIYATNLHKSILHHDPTPPSWLIFLFAVSGTVFLVLGFGFAVWTIVPRLWRDLTPKTWLAFLSSGHAARTAPIGGLIFWDEVLVHSTAEEYVSAVSSADDSQLLRATCQHVFILSGVSRAKFTHVNRAILLTAGGTILTVAAILGT